MKHLKRINEYTRTVGFRYSEPKIELTMSGFFIGDLSNELMKQALDEFEIKSKDINISNKPGRIELEEGVIEVDGIFTINFFVYNDRTDDMISLVTDIERFLHSKKVKLEMVEIDKF
jgi:hypothetical protein